MHAHVMMEIYEHDNCIMIHIALTLNYGHRRQLQQQQLQSDVRYGGNVEAAHLSTDTAVDYVTILRTMQADTSFYFVSIVATAFSVTPALHTRATRLVGEHEFYI